MIHFLFMARRLGGRTTANRVLPHLNSVLVLLHGIPFGRLITHRKITLGFIPYMMKITVSIYDEDRGVQLLVHGSDGAAHVLLLRRCTIDSRFSSAAQLSTLASRRRLGWTDGRENSSTDSIFSSHTAIVKYTNRSLPRM